MSKKKKQNNLFILLSGIVITNALIAEIIGTKIFSLESVFHIPPAQIPLGSFKLDFNLSAGVVLWPVVFVTSDIINEYYGIRGVRKITFLAAGCIAYSFFILWAVTNLPPADFWLALYDSDSNGNPLNINEAFTKIFVQGMGIIIGSLTAFIIGQLMDVLVFQQLRKVTGARFIWLRATGSTLMSQLIDSFVVLVVAFYIFGPWSFEQVIAVGIINYIYKFVVAIALTPVLYVGHYLIDLYLGEKNAREMAEEASKGSLFT